MNAAYSEARANQEKLQTNNGAPTGEFREVIEMKDRQRRFADEYLIDLNATRAYLVAYPSVKRDEVARAAASRMLTNVNVKKYI